MIHRLYYVYCVLLLFLNCLTAKRISCGGTTKIRINIPVNWTVKCKKCQQINPETPQWHWPELCSFLHVCEIREKLLARGLTRPPNGGSATITTFSSSDSVRKACRTALEAWQETQLYYTDLEIRHTKHKTHKHNSYLPIKQVMVEHVVVTEFLPIVKLSISET